MTGGAGEASPGDFLGALRARAGARRATLVYAEGEDARVLDAVADLVTEGVVEAVLLGAPEAVEGGLAARGVTSGVQVLDPTAADASARTLEHLRSRRAGRSDTEEALARMASDPLVQAATLVASGEVDGGVSGCVRTTADVIRAALTCIGLREGITTLSSSFHMVFGPAHPRGPAVLTFTDAGVVPRPDPAQLAEIAEAASDARRRVVGDEPRVAFLSYSTKGSAGGAGVDEVREALDLFRARRPDVVADGELQADAALDPAIGGRKAPGSPVAGRANVLVFPDLAAANLAYKLVQHLGGAIALGPILQGLSRPFNDLSRGAVATDVSAVSCITALMSD